METLTPVQRVAVIAICLALTLLIAMLLVPYIWTQIVERFPLTATPTPSAMLLPVFPTPTQSPHGASAAVLAWFSSTSAGMWLT